MKSWIIKFRTVVKLTKPFRIELCTANHHPSLVDHLDKFKQKKALESKQKSISQKLSLNAK